ncbi:MAG: hypothetical protein ACRDPF_35300, partial [Streptosporangiaceae bacterium]
QARRGQPHRGRRPGPRAEPDPLIQPVPPAAAELPRSCLSAGGLKESQQVLAHGLPGFGRGPVRSLVQVTPAGQEDLEAEIARQVGAVLSANPDRYPQVLAAFSDSPQPAERSRSGLASSTVTTSKVQCGAGGCPVRRRRKARRIKA